MTKLCGCKRCPEHKDFWTEREQALIKEHDERIRMLEYNLFKYWFENNRIEDPSTAITKSLARDIAKLVWLEHIAIRKIIESVDKANNTKRQ